MLLAAEIVVLGDGVDITSGDVTPSALDDTEYGSVVVTGGTSQQTYTIQNTGTDVLNISGIVTTGTNSADFVVSGVPTMVAANNGTATFVVTFDPAATGLRVATVSIDNDDATGSEDPFVFAIQGTGVANTAPTITSGATASAAEGATGTIATVTATDPDAPTFQMLAYSISGGADQAAFSIDSSTGALTFTDPSAIDFENPTDTGGTAGDNVYEVMVQASDGTASVTQTINVTVTDVSVTHTVTLPDATDSYTVAQDGNDIVVTDSMMTEVSRVSKDELVAVIIQGGTGDDSVTLDASLDGNTFALTVNGGGGADAVDGSASTLPVMFNGGSGNDTLTGGGGADVFIGGTGNDSVTGGAGNDSLTGSSGNDTMSGDAGDDFVNGNADADFLTGGDDDDTILGGAGTDTLDGGAGDDFVNGQSGEADIVAGGGGSDTLRGGPATSRWLALLELIQ